MSVADNQEEKQLSKLSLITASYNSAGTIKDTVVSIEKQTYPDIEYILVDGGSKDDTVDIVKANSTRLSQCVSEPDKGIYEAYNKGLALANGEVIGYLNSDDFYCSNDVIANVMKQFEDPSVDAVYADLVYVDWDDTDKILRHWKSKDYVDGDFSRAFVAAHPTLFVRKAVYDKAGGYDLTYRLAADYEFILRIFHKYKVKSVYLPQILVRMRAGGATGESASAIKKQNMEIFSALEKHQVPFSKLNFMLHKIVNRIWQRFKAGSVVMPQNV